MSRPVLRAALERLREQGLIHSRQGAGSYVREVRAAPLGFARVETIADIQRCYEFRICIETTAAALAAARRNQASLEQIGVALSLMDAATDSLTHREDADYAFHLAVAEAANNQYFEASMRALARAHLRRDEAARPVADDRRRQGPQGGLRGAQRDLRGHPRRRRRHGRRR